MNKHQYTPPACLTQGWQPRYIYKGEHPGPLAIEVLPLAAKLELPRLMKVRAASCVAGGHSCGRAQRQAVLSCCALKYRRCSQVCGENMIQLLSPETAPAIVYALKGLKGVGSMIEVWYEVQNKVRQDKALVDSLMMTVEV